VQIHTGSPVV